jgi:hypothetical protein
MQSFFSILREGTHGVYYEVHTVVCPECGFEITFSGSSPMLCGICYTDLRFNSLDMIRNLYDARRDYHVGDISARIGPWY